jgi:hypothetical protein
MSIHTQTHKTIHTQNTRVRSQSAGDNQEIRDLNQMVFQALQPRSLSSR